MSWSSGKDSAAALFELLAGDEYEVVALLTSISEAYRRVSHHGVREALVEDQAAAIGLPLDKVYLPSHGDEPCSNAVYEGIMADVMAAYRAKGVVDVAFGDLFLEDLRAYRERNLSQAGMRGVFPLWRRDTTTLARELIAAGFKSVLSCVEGHVGRGFVGRPYDLALVDSLPAHVDPCGERGEFHTFAYDGPVFRRPVRMRVGEIVIRDGREYADLLLDDDALDPQPSMPPIKQ
jgi:uncharacterized protein (TIGR00290 family)